MGNIPLFIYYLYDSTTFVVIGAYGCVLYQWIQIRSLGRPHSVWKVLFVSFLGVGVLLLALIARFIELAIRPLAAVTTTGNIWFTTVSVVCILYYGVTIVVTEEGADAALAAALEADPDWQSVLADTDGTMWVRADRPFAS